MKDHNLFWHVSKLEGVVLTAAKIFELCRQLLLRKGDTFQKFQSIEDAINKIILRDCEPYFLLNGNHMGNNPRPIVRLFFLLLFLN